MLPWVPEACLALLSLLYYMPLMSLTYMPLMPSSRRPRHLTKACRERTSGTQGTQMSAKCLNPFHREVVKAYVLELINPRTYTQTRTPTVVQDTT